MLNLTFKGFVILENAEVCRPDPDDYLLTKEIEKGKLLIRKFEVNGFKCRQALIKNEWWDILNGKEKEIGENVR